jgi:hypothetical protein
MKKLSCLALSIITAGFAASLIAAPNELTPQEKAEGWVLLFDGQSTAGWRGFKKDAFPSANWAVQEGWMHCLGKGGGDIISKEQYTEFELTWEWKLDKAGNSGLKYFVSEARGPVGHEYQMLDDKLHPDGAKAEGKRVTATFYDVLKNQTPAPTKAPLEINQSRVLVKGNHVEHWLNGAKTLEYELGSPAVKAAVQESKFKDTKDFGSLVKGHILLQDHNNLVWFRNLKIRSLAK